MSHSFPSIFPLPFLSIFFILLLSINVAKAAVPPSKTFKAINQGRFVDMLYRPNEYDANYRCTKISSRVFSLCFYTTTSGAYTLGIRMGFQPSDYAINFRWVWDANRGNPVGENATLTFGTDGNLVLAQADGKLAWQTGTANKGVVGIQLLPNGNLVLQDSLGGYVWQSFDHPSDTLLVGQGLRLTGPTKLVSRVSKADGSEGRYSFVMEKLRLAMYLQSKNSPSPVLYYTNGKTPAPYFESLPIVSMVFNVSFEEYNVFTSKLIIEFLDANSNGYYRSLDTWTTLLARPKYNSTYSFLRLESDGDLKAYTFFDKVLLDAWEVTYSLFGSEGLVRRNACKLPSKCGSFGLCEKNQCVACPRPNGLEGWSESCAPPRLPVCKNGVSDVEYYKVGGVEHFMSDYDEGEGPIAADKCKEKCSKDCGCLGVFYREESSKCLLVPELGTLSKVSNHSHVAYIKMPKNTKL